jgi:uracil-DNA glycosylase
MNLRLITDPIDQSWTIQRIASTRPPRTWEKVFEEAAPELAHISSILEEQEQKFGQFYPLKADIFAAFNLTPLPMVKVVIVGQDPYPQSIHIDGATVPRASGLSFSLRRGDSIPSSLRTIYTELEETVRGFRRPDHGDLRAWARQGVLLLNTCLTVRPGMPKSHGDLWLGFIKKVLKSIAEINPNCVFLLWGRPAQDIGTKHRMIGERSVILEAPHPSGMNRQGGFLGTNHFNLANRALIAQGKVGINWHLHDPPAASGSQPVAQIIPPATSTFAPVDISTLPAIIQSKAPAPIILPNIMTGPNKIVPVPVIRNVKRISPSRASTSAPPAAKISPPSTPVAPMGTYIPRVPGVIPSLPSIQFGAEIEASIIKLDQPQVTPEPKIEPIVAPIVLPQIEALF